MYIKLNFFLVLLLFISLVSKAIEPTYKSTFTKQLKVEVSGGTEDFAIDTVMGNRLLISCDERRDKTTQGSIWAYNLDSTLASELPFSELLDFNFHPHGVSFISTPKGNYLFVINHTNKNTSEIDRFIVQKDKLVLDHRFLNIVGKPNDIFAVSANEFYYSDYKLIGGSIVHFNGEYNKIVKHLNYPNGIFIKNHNLYFSTTINGHLYKVDLNTGKKRKLAKVKGADNIMDFSANELIVTSHPRFIKFIKHYKNSTNLSPSLAFKVNITDGEKSILYYNNGSAISATSTAYLYNNKLYLGQVFDPFILVIQF